MDSGQPLLVVYFKLIKQTHLWRYNVGIYLYIGAYCVINRVTIGNYSWVDSAMSIGGMEQPYWYLSFSSVFSNINK